MVITQLSQDTGDLEENSPKEKEGASDLCCLKEDDDMMKPAEN